MKLGNTLPLAEVPRLQYQSSISLWGDFAGLHSCWGKKQINAWTDRLKASINNARNLPIKLGISSMYVIHQATGGRYTRHGCNSRWQQTTEDATTAFPHLSFDFTFHDLKTKGVSDLNGTLAEKQAISGHMTISQTARYDRKISIVPVVSGQNKNSR